MDEAFPGFPSFGFGRRASQGHDRIGQPYRPVGVAQKPVWLKIAPESAGRQPRNPRAGLLAL
jgi:hypothetical protein